MRVAVVTTGSAFQFSEAERKPNPGLLLPETAVFTVLCYLVPEMLLWNKIRFSNSLQTM